MQEDTNAEGAALHVIPQMQTREWERVKVPVA